MNVTFISILVTGFVCFCGLVLKECTGVQMSIILKQSDAQASLHTMVASAVALLKLTAQTLVVTFHCGIVLQMKGQCVVAQCAPSSGRLCV